MTKVALIGFGRRGKSIYGSLLSNEKAKVSAIFDTAFKDSSILDDVELFSSDAKKMISKVMPDLAIISTPPWSHFEYIKLCEEMRIPVICEKPIVLGDDQLKKIRDFKIKIYPAFQFKYDPYINKAFSLIGKSRLLEITASQRVKVHQEGWKGSKRFSGGGTLLDNSSHFIDLAINNFGSPKQAIFIPGKTKNGIEQASDTILFYKSFQFKIHTDWNSAIGKENKLIIKTGFQDIEFCQTNQLSSLTTRKVNNRSGWTKRKNVDYFIPRGQERNLTDDPLGQTADKKALDIMTDHFLSDLPDKKSQFAKNQLDCAIRTGEIINKLYANPNKIINL